MPGRVLNFLPVCTCVLCPRLEDGEEGGREWADSSSITTQPPSNRHTHTHTLATLQDGTPNPERKQKLGGAGSRLSSSVPSSLPFSRPAAAMGAPPFLGVATTFPQGFGGGQLHLPPPPPPSSRFRGVQRLGAQWRAVISLNGVDHHVGCVECVPDWLPLSLSCLTG